MEPRELRLSREIKRLKQMICTMGVPVFTSSPFLQETVRLIEEQPYSPWQVSWPMVHRAAVFCKCYAKRSATSLYLFSPMGLMTKGHGGL